MQTAKLKSLIYVLVVTVLAACSDSKFKLTSQEGTSVENETTTDSYYDDVDDMSVTVVSSDNATNGGRVSTGGRTITVSDSRFNCSGIVVEITPDPTSTVDHPRGTITVNFGSGCTDPRGNVRAGIMIITYDGRRFMPGSVITTTFSGYSINGVQLEGVRTVTNLSTSVADKPVFKIELAGGKATWPDGTFATREVTITREWTRGTSPIQDYWTVTGSAVGTNRDGLTYTMEITDALVYKRECSIAKVFIASKGVKVLTAGDKLITIDYGDGTCDRKVTVTVNGQTQDTTVTGD